LHNDRVKLERIQILKEEADELQAMIAHIEEKLEVHQSNHRDLLAKKKLMEQRLAEAKQIGREVAAQNISAEVFVANSEISESAGNIKSLQREMYFIRLERKRKVGVLNKLREELNEEKRKADLKKQIEEKIKKDVSASRRVCVIELLTFCFL
jgi:chromosome segregation ATPase